MAYKNLHHFITILEEHNELIRIKEFVDPVLEICEITDRFSKEPDGGKALLFENTGTKFPVLTNALGSYKRICLALSTTNLDEFGAEMNLLFQTATSEKRTFFDKLKTLPVLAKISSWMPRKVTSKGECQEVILHNPDLSILPILKCWPADGGRFVTLPLVHTIDPVTGIRNLGMYRMQVFENNMTGMHWHRHKTGARHFEEYKKLGKRMPVAVALGGDPAYTWSATAPLPDQIDEYILAGFIRKKNVKLVKCITQDIYVPNDVDFVIEGYVDPQEELIWEGPFGDHTGFYSLEDWYPRFHITCITHRKNAVYPATIVGVPPQEDAWIARATERFFLTPMRMTLAPELIDIDIPPVGVAHNLTILKINKTFPGQGSKVINALWGAGQMMFNKTMIVVDGNVDIHNYTELFLHIAKNTRIPDDLLFSKGPLDVLDHSSDKFAFGSKIGIDATTKLPEEITSTVFNNVSKQISINELKTVHTAIENIIQIKDSPVLFINIKDNCLHETKEVFAKLSKSEPLKEVKLVVAFEQSVTITDNFMCCWLALSNTEPNRDFQMLHVFENQCLFVDATIKTLQKDKFSRNWPNVVTSSNETILNINNKWKQLFNIELIISPSIYYSKLTKGDTAQIE